MKQKILFVIILFALSIQIFPGELNLSLTNQKLLTVNAKEFRSVCKQIFRYECNRLDFTNNLTVNLVFTNDQPKQVEVVLRGRAVPDSSKIYFYIDSSFAETKLYAVFAHELAHIIKIIGLILLKEA